MLVILFHISGSDEADRSRPALRYRRVGPRRRGDSFLVEDGWRRGAGSHGGGCCSPLQFALAEGLDGAQQGAATSTRCVRGGERRRTGGRVQRGRKGGRRRRRSRSSQGFWMRREEKGVRKHQKNRAELDPPSAPPDSLKGF